jgi:hypothetical protein
MGKEESPDRWGQRAWRTIDRASPKQYLGII